METVKTENNAIWFQRIINYSLKMLFLSRNSVVCIHYQQLIDLHAKQHLLNNILF